MNGKRQDAFLGSQGFYIALALCVAIVCVIGAVFLFGGGDTATTEVNSSVDGVTSSQISEEPTLTTPQPQQVVDTSSAETETDTAPTTEEPQDTSSTITPMETLEQEVVVLEETPESTEPVANMEETKIVAPLAGETIATFSLEELQFNETVGDWRLHDAVDIAAVAGTPVVAAQSGTVVSLETGGTLGNVITISHADGYETVYASLEEHFLVEVGDSVNAGQEIGTVGNTSITESALGAHLHFAVRQDGNAIDPLSYLNP